MLFTSEKETFVKKKRFYKEKNYLVNELLNFVYHKNALRY